MSNQKRNLANPFYLKNGRAMGSLGPLSKNTYCPYRCAFCYVQDAFISYANLGVDEIIAFLKENRSNYKIIYVSGDTDSFAPPRTKEGLTLLERIVNEINCDLLFTTRALFSADNYSQLKKIIEQQRGQGKAFFACVSVLRLSDDLAYLEPKPIPTPEERIDVLRQLKGIGATTVLATRPFLPIVPPEQYLQIIDNAKKHVDIVLGECFYFIRDGKIQNRVFPNGVLPEYEENITKNQKMPFDDNVADWDIWDSTEYQNIVRKKCEDCGIVFSMHSEDAIRQFREKATKQLVGV